MKQWRKIRLWILFGPFLPFMYCSALIHRNKTFAERFSYLQRWCSIIVALSFTKVRVVYNNSVPLRDGHLIVINHQGSMDPFLIVATLPIPATAVTKVENMSIPVLGTWLTSLNAVSFKRESIKDSVRMLKDTAKLLKVPRNVVIFPEGTRSKSNTMGELKAGSLKAAYMAQADILVVTLVNSYTILDEVGVKRKPVTVVYDGVIAYEDYKNLNSQEVANMIQEKMQKHIDQYS